MNEDQLPVLRSVGEKLDFLISDLEKRPQDVRHSAMHDLVSIGAVFDTIVEALTSVRSECQTSHIDKTQALIERDAKCSLIQEKLDQAWSLMERLGFNVPAEVRPN